MESHVAYDWGFPDLVRSSGKLSWGTWTSWSPPCFSTGSTTFYAPQDQFVSIFRLFQIKKKKGFMIVATVLIIIPKLIRYFLNLCRWNFSYYIFIIRISFIFGSNAWPEIRFFLPELANLSFQPIFYYLCCRNVFVKICLTPIRNLRCDKELDKINRWVNVIVLQYYTKKMQPY